MYVAHKYIVTNLTKQCVKFLEENLSADTAVVLLEQCNLYKEKDLKTKVLQKIEEEAPAVLSSEDFIKLSTDALHEVLQLNLRITKEVETFDAAIRWAKNKCQQLRKTTEGANLREVLGGNLFLIRFPIMSLSDINDIVVPQNILTANEGFQILRYITTEKSKPDNLPFLTEPRSNLDQTLQSLLIPAPYMQLSGNLYDVQSLTRSSTLNCTVSRPMKIKKILLHAITKKRQSQFLRCTLTVSLTQNGSTLFNYNDQPVIIKESAEIPPHCSVDGKDIRVKAGNLHMEIRLELKRTTTGYGCCSYEIQASAPATSEISDQFVSINFSPITENLLLGIEYSLD